MADDGGALLLVRHRYAPGWHFPGGAVDPGETVFEAAAREVREETGIVIPAQGELLGVFHNRGFSRRDHVVLLRCRSTNQQIVDLPASLEIAEARYFAADALPEDLSAGTARRLAELRGDRTVSVEW